MVVTFGLKMDIYIKLNLGLVFFLNYNKNLYCFYKQLHNKKR